MENKSFLCGEFCVLACSGKVLEKRRCHLFFLLNMLLNALWQNSIKTSQMPRCFNETEDMSQWLLQNYYLILPSFPGLHFLLILNVGK